MGFREPPSLIREAAPHPAALSLAPPDNTDLYPLAWIKEKEGRIYFATGPVLGTDVGLTPSKAT
jgi:hypothetical protein